MSNKQWVIPDVHGCCKTLRSLIETQIKPSKSDELYFIGDYIDRGPNSKGVIDFIMDLQQKEYTLRLLLGNHEEYCLKAYDEDQNKKSIFGLKFKTKIQSVWEQHGGKETLESFGVKFASQIPVKYIDWMRNLKLFFELEKHIIVHAGMNFNIDDPLTDRFAMLWAKEFKVVPTKIRNKILIHGHTPIDLEFMDHIMKSKSYHFIDLDNGVYILNKAGYGNLIGYEINSGQYLVQSNIDY